MTPDSRPTRVGPVEPKALRALLFDLDGVITRTATIHASAWRWLLDDFRQRWGEQHSHEYEPLLPCSKTRSPACRRGGQATSGSLSVSTEEPAPTFSAVGVTLSARTYRSCWGE